MKNYIYKIKEKYIKNKEIENYLNLYKDEYGNDSVYSVPIQLTPNTPIVRSFINIFNSKGWQKTAHVNEAKVRKEMARQGINFEYYYDANTKEHGYKVVEDEALITDLGSVNLCVEMEDKDTMHALFISCGESNFVYYNYKILDQNIPYLKNLIPPHMFYKALVKEPKKKEEPKEPENNYA